VARRFARNRTIRPPSRTVVWLGSGLAFTNLVSGTKQVLLTLNATALALRPFTIIRTRLEITFGSDQIAGSENVQGAFGIIVVNDIAAALGPTATPGPITDTDADWFVYQGMMNTLQVVSGSGFNAADGNRKSYVVDSKAMRKVDLEEDIAWISELRVAVGAVIALEGRIAIKLH